MPDPVDSRTTSGQPMDEAGVSHGPPQFGLTSAVALIVEGSRWASARPRPRNSASSSSAACGSRGSYHLKRVKHTGQDRITIGVMARTAEDDDADRPRRGVPEVRR